MNRELRAISECNKAMMRASDEQGLLTDVCRSICATVGYRMAWVGIAEYNEAKSIRPLAWGGAEDGYLANASITWADTERGRGPTGLAVRTGKTNFFQDFATEPRAAPWRVDAIARGYRSSIALPLYDMGGNVFEVFTLYASEPNGFTPAEVKLLEELAGDLAFGIMVLRERATRKQAEEALNETQKTLEEAQRIAHVGSWERKSITGDVHWSKELYAIYGVDPMSFVPKTNSFAEFIHPEDQESVNRIMNQIITRGKLAAMDFRIVLNDKTIRYLHATSEIATFDETGKPFVLVGTTQDITESRKAEERVNNLNQMLQRQTEELKVANKELESYSFTIANNLKAPLRHMDGFSQALMEDYSDKLDEEGKRYLQSISESSRLMSQFLDKLLELSSVTTSELNYDQVNLSRMMQSIVTVFQNSQPKRQIDFRFNGD